MENGERQKLSLQALVPELLKFLRGSIRSKMILAILFAGLAGLFPPVWQVLASALMRSSLKIDLPADSTWVSLLFILGAITWGVFEAKRQDKVEKSRELGFRTMEMLKVLLSTPTGLPPGIAVEVFREHYGFEISYEEIVYLAGLREQLPVIEKRRGAKDWVIFDKSLGGYRFASDLHSVQSVMRIQFFGYNVIIAGTAFSLYVYFFEGLGHQYLLFAILTMFLEYQVRNSIAALRAAYDLLTLLDK